MRKLSIRVVRKVAKLSHRLLNKGVGITAKIEGKTTRILDGTDYSVKVVDSIPLEQIYYNSLPYITPLNPSLPAIGSTPTVTLLLPTLDGKSFFGGTATALIVAAKLALKRKSKLRIVQTLKTGSSSELENFFQREGVGISNDQIKVISVADRKFNFYGYLSIHPDDLFIASAWWDAHLLSQLPLPKKFVYLVQDFEPIFYNNSDMYVLSEETYKSNLFIPLCNTKLMYDFMRERGYQNFLSEEAMWFEPAVSRLESGSVVKKPSEEKRRIFLYGRPDVHRNLFFSALKAISDAFQSGALSSTEWEVYMAGQDNIPNIKLPVGVTVKNLGKMPMEKYIEFSKTIDIAVSPMMAPHPNYPTLEFSSIGAAVVTTKYENKQSLEHYNSNIVMSELTSESMMESIVAASKLTYKDRLHNTSSSSLPSNWQEALDSQIIKLLKVIG